MTRQLTRVEILTEALRKLANLPFPAAHPTFEHIAREALAAAEQAPLLDEGDEGDNGVVEVIAATMLPKPALAPSYPIELLAGVTDLAIRIRDALNEHMRGK